MSRNWGDQDLDAHHLTPEITLEREKRADRTYVRRLKLTFDNIHLAIENFGWVDKNANHPSLLLPQIPNSKLVKPLGHAYLRKSNNRTFWKVNSDMRSLLTVSSPHGPQGNILGHQGDVIHVQRVKIQKPSRPKALANNLNYNI